MQSNLKLVSKGKLPRENLSMGIKSHECDGERFPYLGIFFAILPLFPNLRSDEVVIEG